MALTLISTHTASADATIDITSGITDTYDSYEFHCVNIHPATTSGQPNFGFQVDTGTNTNYNQPITSSQFQAFHDSRVGVSDWSGFDYSAGQDQAQGTALQQIAHGRGDEDDDSSAVILTLYAPSSGTYVKHFTSIGQGNSGNASQYSGNTFAAGYINTTTAITRIRFKFDSGNIDAGTIKMFGVT
jgi:hypothetical protein